MEDIITLEVRNWEKFQHHNGKRTYDWFKTSIFLFDDPQIQSLTPSGFKFWMFLLTLCGRKKSRVVSVSIRDVSHLIRVKSKLIRDELSDLVRFQIVTLISGTTEENRREEKRINTIGQIAKEAIRPTVIPFFDFEEVYKKYPRKLKKKQGLLKLTKTVKCKDDYDKLLLAIERFCKFHETSATELKFIPHFSTFTNSWEDWIDPQTGTGNGFDKKFDWNKVFKE